jgi:hypothetical protein
MPGLSSVTAQPSARRASQENQMSKTNSNNREETKSAAIQRLLNRKSGATLASLQKATGWQPHSVRAALSTLRKTGCTIEKMSPKKDGDAVTYRITGAPERS